MIAALASGLLGQLEGLGSLSSGISGVSALVGGANDGTSTSVSAATPQDPAAKPGHRHHGRPSEVSTLSDPLQSLLLQQQEDPSLDAQPGAIQADQVDQPLSLG